MNLREAILMFGQGSYPGGGAYVTAAIVLLLLMLCVVAVVMYCVRRQFPRMQPEKTPRQLHKRAIGFLLGCLLVGATALVIDIVAGELEFSERVDVNDDGRVIGYGTVRSEAWYRIGRTVYAFSMLGFIGGGVTIGVRAQTPLWRNGVSWGMLIAGAFAIFAG